MHACRWEITFAEKLPDYLKICFKALYDITNEISYKVYQKHGWNPISSLKKAVRCEQVELVVLERRQKKKKFLKIILAHDVIFFSYTWTVGQTLQCILSRSRMACFGELAERRRVHEECDREFGSSCGACSYVLPFRPRNYPRSCWWAWPDAGPCIFNRRDTSTLGWLGKCKGNIKYN